MKQQLIRTLLSMLVALIVLLPGVTQASSSKIAVEHEDANPARINQSTIFGGELWKRTELYFGSSKPDGTAVSEQEFRTFVDEEVTPRFPDGLTILQGYGQFRNSQNVIIEEQSFVLVLFYPRDDKDANRELEEIRAAYKESFAQESVLRVDSVERLSF